MQAFALPSFYDGRVRLNLIGRERRGMIRPEEYPQALERMERLVRDCTDPATGESIVDVVEYQAPRNPRAATQTQADLVFVWKGALACFDHPTLGRIGPVPYRRPGGHTGLAGMAFVHGAERVGDFGTRSSFDVVPTIIDMMGLPPQRSLSGTSLLTHA
jgi:predicted AlkP superfamily phosphohydrolase/phosphomutase